MNNPMIEAVEAVAAAVRFHLRPEAPIRERNKAFLAMNDAVAALRSEPEEAPDWWGTCEHNVTPRGACQQCRDKDPRILSPQDYLTAERPEANAGNSPNWNPVDYVKRKKEANAGNVEGEDAKVLLSLIEDLYTFGYQEGRALEQSEAKYLPPEHEVRALAVQTFRRAESLACRLSAQLREARRHDCAEWRAEGIGCQNCNIIAHQVPFPGTLAEKVHKAEAERDALAKKVKDFDWLEENYKRVCDRLQDCVQKHGLGLGGEQIDRLVVEHVDALAKKLEEARALALDALLQLPSSHRMVGPLRDRLAHLNEKEGT